MPQNRIISFSESNRKNGAFQNFSTWSILKQKRNRKWNYSIFGHFKISWKCYHMTKSSFTCFLGHFILPPVNLSPSWLVKMKFPCHNLFLKFWVVRSCTISVTRSPTYFYVTPHFDVLIIDLRENVTKSN